MSSGYGNLYLGRRFAWKVATTYSKSFMDDEQMEGFIRSHEARSETRFLAASPLWEAALEAEKDVDVLPHDPFLRPLELKRLDGLDALAPEAYPLTLRLDLGVDEHERRREGLELTLARPPKPGAIERLRLSLRGAAAGVAGDGGGAFGNLVAETRWGSRAGLYAGVRARALPEREAELRPRLKEALELLWPVVEARSTAWPEIAPPRDPVYSFNPWGPLSDSLYMRDSWELGRVAVILAFKDGLAWPRIGEWFHGHPLDLGNEITAWETAAAGLSEPGTLGSCVLSASAHADPRLEAAIRRSLGRPGLDDYATRILNGLRTRSAGPSPS